MTACSWTQMDVFLMEELIQICLEKSAVNLIWNTIDKRATNCSQQWVLGLIIIYHLKSFILSFKLLRSNVLATLLRIFYWQSSCTSTTNWQSSSKYSSWTEVISRVESTFSFVDNFVIVEFLGNVPWRYGYESFDLLRDYSHPKT